MPDLGLRPVAQAPVLRDQVFARLEELIIDGTLRPGDRLLEVELAEQLQVSRNPVREALSILAHSGWVDLRPRHGAVVHTPTPKEINDFFEVRGVLEQESARWAARNATESDVECLGVILEEGLEAVRAGDDAHTSLANSTFHDCVTSIANNQVLDEVLGLMKKRLRWYFAPVARLRGRASWDEHAELVSALAAHDENRAAAVMAAHSQQTASLYRGIHEAHVDSG